MSTYTINSILKFLITLIAISSSFKIDFSGRNVFSKFNLNIKNVINQNILAAIIISTSFQNIPTVYAESYPVKGSDQIMVQKTHGTSDEPVMEKLRFGVDVKLADKISNYNRHWAEFAGYWTTTNFFNEVKSEAESNKEITFYDSVTGKPLFIAPRGRSFNDFKAESLVHGWPSFRDEEVVWENVRVLKDGETVSTTGTHLGHNLPDKRNRYCINLVSIAGNPKQ